MRINPFIYGLLVLLVFLGTVQGFKAAGIWSVSGKVSSSGDAVLPDASDVNSIKGWMTLQQVSTAFNLPVDEILTEFSLPLDTPPTAAIKDLENETFSVTGLRTWLQYGAGESSPESTEPVSTREPAPEPTITSQAQVEAPLETALATEHVAADRSVTGKTTFQDLLDWGVPDEVIRQILGEDLPPLTTVIKDYVSAKGLEFSSIKSLLQAEVDKVK